MYGCIHTYMHTYTYKHIHTYMCMYVCMHANQVRIHAILPLSCATVESAAKPDRENRHYVNFKSLSLLESGRA